MATPAEIERTILRIMEEELHLEVPSAEADLFDAGVIDSLSLVDLLFRLEQEIDEEIPLEELDVENFRSVSRIARALSRNGFGP